MLVVTVVVVVVVVVVGRFAMTDSGTHFIRIAMDDGLLLSSHLLKCQCIVVVVVVFGWKSLCGRRRCHNRIGWFTIHTTTIGSPTTISGGCIHTGMIFILHFGNNSCILQISVQGGKGTPRVFPHAGISTTRIIALL